MLGGVFQYEAENCFNLKRSDVESDVENIAFPDDILFTDKKEPALFLDCLFRIEGEHRCLVEGGFHLLSFPGSVKIVLRADFAGDHFSGTMRVRMGGTDSPFLDHRQLQFDVD